jgi:hypothetical protein
MRQWRDIADFLPPLRTATRGNEEFADLDDGVLLDFLRDSMIEFCEDTKVIRHQMDIPIECGICEYPLILDTCEDILGVGEVRYGADCETDCAGSRSWNWGDVTFRLDEDSDILRINRAPEDEGQTLHMEVYTSPTREAERVDALLYQRYRNPITYLTLERVHLMTNVPWQSVSRAQYYRQMYAKREIEVNERRMDRGMENRMLMPRFRMGAGRRRF